jgi:hypothetical protein
MHDVLSSSSSQASLATSGVNLMAGNAQSLLFRNVHSSEIEYQACAMLEALPLCGQ